MLIIGTAGRTGSGKTTVVRKIAGQFFAEEVSIISQESYYCDHRQLSMEERNAKNFDHPESVEFDQLIYHIKKCRYHHSSGRNESSCHKYSHESY